MKITDKIKKKIKKFLRIHEWNESGFDIDRLLNYESNAAKNITWYNGDSHELSQLFGQIDSRNNSFWGAVETKGLEIRKIHTGLPKLLVNTLTNVSLSDMNDITFGNATDRDLWEEIAEDNDFNKLIKKATNNTLKVGDGAFKISFNDGVSKLPIIEFYSGECVDYTYNRGRVKEVIFYNKYDINTVKYTLAETYGYGYVKYTLYKEETIVPLDTIPQTAGLEDVIFNENVMLAVPFMVFESEIYQGRGASIFDGKNDAFDALDEVVSQWQDAIRAGRVKTYIPDCLIPRDANAGFLLKPNAFDNRFIKVGSSLQENARNEIKTEQPNIQVGAYLETYMTFLDMALQGLVSPSTLGIDVKKLDNAESQREKEKTTLYTRQTIIDTLTKVIKKLVQVTFDAYNLQYENDLSDIDLEVTFGEYSNPSFEAVVETMSNPNTPMSIEAKVEELWGDSKSKEWKDEEIKRIKTERGLITMDEPSFSTDYMMQGV